MHISVMSFTDAEKEIDEMWNLIISLDCLDERGIRFGGDENTAIYSKAFNLKEKIKNRTLLMKHELIHNIQYGRL